MFQIGDEVYCVKQGGGRVINVSDCGGYPVEVEFFNKGISNESYSLLGKEIGSDYYPCLFHAKGYKRPVAGKEPRRIPSFEVDTLLVVWDDFSMERVIRYFSHVDELTGFMACFDCGASSVTIGKDTSNTSTWQHYEVFNNK